MNITDASVRLLRWRLRLSEFNFAINYKKGSRNLHADAMSHLSTLSETRSNRIMKFRVSR